MKVRGQGSGFRGQEDEAESSLTSDARPQSPSLKKVRGQGSGFRGQEEDVDFLQAPEPHAPSPSLKRYAKVAGAAARVGVGVAGNRLSGGGTEREAALFRAALGGLKGPLMKVAQLLASLPDFLPPAYAAELATLQSQAPSMGWPFVRRRMAAELGPDWQAQFASFEKQAAAAASLGQVHRAVALDGQKLACKLQYPDMDSVVESDLRQLKFMLGLLDRFGGAVQAQDAYDEIADRLREELDYGREARNMAVYESIYGDAPWVHVPRVRPELSSRCLLSMSWLEGEPLLEAVENRSQEERNLIATNMFRVWYAPFYRYGVIHGDPHLGNYTICPDNSINLMDFGCIRVFKPTLVQAVILMFEALRDNNQEQIVEAYRLWGFEKLSKETVEILTIWARFIYAPLLEDRVRPISETNDTRKGRTIAGEVYRALKANGGVTIPREFVMIDRASIGLGGVFLHLRAEVNWFQAFNEMVEDFSLDALRERQSKIPV